MPLIEALRNPDAYPHAVETPVRIVETHVSWVLLTGPYAYKIKKPLRLSFLDYSTLERRQRFCEEELRLNRRYAPDMYLDVVPIGGTDGAPRIGEARGPALDYAVRMVQFDTREELDALIDNDALGRGEIEQLGARTGAFHADAARAPAGEPYGSPSLVHRVTLDNFAELESLAMTAPVPDRLRCLRLRTADLFATRQAAMTARREAGWTRECHGDLHCANVVRWRGRLTPFDGIEFDPALRYVDVVNDIAFLSMDLAVRGRPDLRHALLNAWTESLGDYAGLELLPYYEVYRALVRAKVAGLRVRQAADTVSSAAAARASVARYLDWATAQGDRPAAQLIVTCGLSGSGKTWLARQLAAELRALHVRSDIERKRLAGLSPLADSRSPPDAGLYTKEFNDRTYRRLAECARGCLLGRESVIVDAAFLRRHERRSLLAIAASIGAPASILHCTSPVDVLRQRIASRRAAQNDPSEADVALLDRQPSYWEPLADDERAITIEVDTSLPQEMQGFAQRLRARPPAD
jgi:hypothetical protein